MKTNQADNATTLPKGRKRTKTQREADLLFIESLVVRAVPQAIIAVKLAEIRPYRVSRSQIRDDIAVLRKRWQAEALEMRSAAVLVALRKLDALEAEAWDAWERSKQATTRTTLTRKSRGAKGEPAPTTGPTDDIKSAVSVSNAGDPAFIGKILDAMSARARLLGLDAPSKHEHGGPDGGPIPIAAANVPLTEADQQALLERHFQRMQEDRESGEDASKRKSSA